METEKDQLEENIPQMENDEHEKTAQVAKMQDERVATQEKLAQLQSKLNDAKGYSYVFYVNFFYILRNLNLLVDSEIQ